MLFVCRTVGTQLLTHAHNLDDRGLGLVPEHPDLVRGVRTAHTCWARRPRRPFADAVQAEKRAERPPLEPADDELTEVGGGRVPTLRENATLFLSFSAEFPYVCPEPVLAKRAILISENGARKRREAFFAPQSRQYP